MLASCSFCGAYGSDFGAACWQPTVRLGACWNEFGAVCLQPTAILEPIGPSLGLYVGNLQVLWGPLDRVWCCMLATYIVLKRHVGASLGLDVGNLQVLWGVMGPIGPSLVLYVGNLHSP